MPLKHRPLFLAAVVTLGPLVGCAGRPSLIPNSDPALRKTSAQFASDAAKRHPFNAALPSGGTAKAKPAKADSPKKAAAGKKKGDARKRA